MAADEAAGDQEEGEVPPPPEGPTAPPQEPEQEETVVEEAKTETSVGEMDVDSTDSDIVEIQVSKKGIATNLKDYLSMGAGGRCSIPGQEG